MRKVFGENLEILSGDNMDFKPGMKVVPIRPKANDRIGKNHIFYWIDSQQKSVGMVLEVRKICSCGCKGITLQDANGKRVSGTWKSSWLTLLEKAENQYRKTCKWCKNVKTIQKTVDAVDFTFNYCPECGR